MPKKTRITVATTTATRPIIAPKRGPSPSMLPASWHVGAGTAPFDDELRLGSVRRTEGTNRREDVSA